MKGWALTFLVVLACVSLAVNAALWHDRRGLMEETAKLRASVKTLSAARTADEYARSLRDNLSDEARHNATQKQKELDRIAADSVGLDDSAFLESLLRLLAKDSNRAPDTAGKPACNGAQSGDAGRADAKP